MNEYMKKTNNITHENIISYINQGIEMAGWNPFIFIDISNKGILISGIIPNEKGTYDSIFIELFDSMLSVENIIYKYFNNPNQSENRMFYNDIELEETTKVLFNTEFLQRNSLGLSTLIMSSGHDNFWNQCFFEAKVYEIFKEGTEDEFIHYDFGIRELAIHTNLQSCIDHMYTFFGYD